MTHYAGKVGLIQRALPNYRAPFFNALGRACRGGLGVFAGAPRPSEMISSVDTLEDAQLTLGKNLHLFQGRFYHCVQLGLLDWLKTLNPDILIGEANPRYLTTPAAFRWMHAQHRPVIGWGLGAPPVMGSFAQLRQQRRRRFLRQFDGLLTYSRTGAEEYAQLGFPESKIFVAVNAVMPAPTHPLPDRPAFTHGRRARVLFVGRLQARKNIPNLIQACAQLPAELQPECVIVGDGPEKGNLEALAATVYPATTFTGALYDEALTAQFNTADLFVLPGTGGLAIQQAMSYGLPIIAAEADGTQSDLVRPANGWQIPSDDLPALRTALMNALENPRQLRLMGEESYRIAAEEINLEQMVAVFVDALNRSQR